jgi:hypothetical protein
MKLLSLAFALVAAPFLGAAQDYDFAKMIQPVPVSAKFEDPGYIVWCGSMVKGDDGKYHMLYSRWPAKLGHYAWVSHSEVAHAVADHPLGPYRPAGIALPERGKDFWDGLCTHNPTVMKFGKKYYLYYMGNTGDRKKGSPLNWTHRNNQRIGVAVADSPAGPWVRSDKPLIEPTPDFHDALCLANPSVVQRPDGGFLMVYIAAEDPFIWQAEGTYWAIVKDFKGGFTKAGASLALFRSTDGLDWQPATHPLVSRLLIRWENGTKSSLMKLERPQLYFENNQPTVLFCAAALRNKLHQSFNVQIPLAIDPP